jgi:hypothetical protein
MFEAAPHPASLKLAIAALVLIAALFFVLVHLRAQSAARRARSWPVTQGVVSASRTAQRWGFGNGVWAAGLWYVPEIAYRYEVDGRVYTGRHVFLSDTGFSKRRQAQEVIDRYPVDATVSVLHDPANPKRACLEPVRRERRALGIAVLLAAIAAAALAAG